jgi:Zn finger protein HypA/HybF involved in hydrogenase expression
MKKKEVKLLCPKCNAAMITKEDFDICPKCGAIQYKIKTKGK